MPQTPKPPYPTHLGVIWVIFWHDFGIILVAFWYYLGVRLVLFWYGFGISWVAFLLFRYDLGEQFGIILV